MIRLFTLLLTTSTSLTIHASVTDVTGTYRMRRTCADGSRPNDSLAEESPLVTFDPDGRLEMLIEYLDPDSRGVCADYQTGTYELKDGDLRARVTAETYLGHCSASKHPFEPNEAALLGFTPTAHGFSAVSDTVFDEGGSCKTGVKMNVELTRVPEPAR